MPIVERSRSRALLRPSRRTLAALVVLLITLPASPPRAVGAYSALVDPSIQYQVLQGWGTSLAWWANVVGGFPEPVRSDYIRKVFDPVDGLGLNVVRYNIGGGENPRYHFMEYRAAVPGFERPPASGTGPRTPTSDGCSNRQLPLE